MSQIECTVCVDSRIHINITRFIQPNRIRNQEMYLQHTSFPGKHFSCVYVTLDGPCNASAGVIYVYLASIGGDWYLDHLVQRHCRRNKQRTSNKTLLQQRSKFIGKWSPNKQHKHERITTQTNAWKHKTLQITQSRNLVSCGLVGNETDALHLTKLVESDDTDEGAGVSLLALLELTNDLGGISAPEHGQLPHCPVASVVVSWGPVVLTVHESVLQGTNINS